MGVMHCPSKAAFAPLPPRMCGRGMETKIVTKFGENFKISGGKQIDPELQILAEYGRVASFRR